MGTMTRERFDQEMSRLDKAYGEKLSRSQEAIRRGVLETARAALEVKYRAIPGLIPEAAETCADMLLSAVDVQVGDGTLRDKSTGQPVDLDQALASWLSSRPWVRATASSAGPANSAAGWDINRAAEDDAYMRQWKAADPAGFAQAWKGYVASRDSGRRKNTLPPGPDAEIERAKTDPAFMVDWKRRDPCGFQARWNREIKRMASLPVR